MKENNNEIPSSENSESQILNSRISKDSKIESTLGVSTFPEIQEDLKEIESILEQRYTIDDLIDVWCRGCTNGATLWQYCQEQNYKLPSSFEAGLMELVNEVRSSKDKSQALQAMLNNNMLLLGVFTEKQ